MIKQNKKDGELGCHCLDRRGFNEMILSPASSGLAAMCVLSRFKDFGQQQKVSFSEIASSSCGGIKS